MKIAIFGGSFNPVHLGHLKIAEEAIKIGYEKVLFIPAKTSPLKDINKGSSVEHRIAMLELAIKNIPWASLWTGDIRRPGRTYSIDTVDELKRLGILSEKPGFIIGDDLIATFSSWKEAERLAEYTVILLALRNNGQYGYFPYAHQKLGNCKYLESSSKIRQSLGTGENIDIWLPTSVANYIYKNGLYGTVRNQIKK